MRRPKSSSVNGWNTSRVPKAVRISIPLIGADATASMAKTTSELVKRTTSPDHRLAETKQ